MNRNLTVCLISLLLVLGYTPKSIAQNSKKDIKQEISLKTSLEKGKPIILEMSVKGNISINWGDGEIVEYTEKTINDNGGYIEGSCKGSTIIISQGQNLQKLYASSIGLSEVVLGDLPNLKLISLTNNAITQILGCENTLIEDINLSRNQLTDAKFLQNLSKLKELRISTNKLTELNLNSCKKLTYIDCSNNQLKSLEIKELAELKTLNCKKNELTQLDLSQQKVLEKIQISKNQLSTLQLENLSFLKMVEADNNKLTLLSLKGNTALKTLDISNNELEVCSLDKIFEQLPTLKEKIKYGKNLILKNNKGVKTSKTQTAIEKNWTPDIKGDGSGCTNANGEINKDELCRVFFDSIQKRLYSNQKVEVVLFNTLGIKVQNFIFDNFADLKNLNKGNYIIVYKDCKGFKNSFIITI